MVIEGRAGLLVAPTGLPDRAAGSIKIGLLWPPGSRAVLRSEMNRDYLCIETGYCFFETM